MRYVITGGSGYIGSRLIERLVQDEETERILIADVRPPRSSHEKTDYRECDVSGSDIHELLKQEQPDVLVHLAFILNPIHDESRMYEVDVNGCQNVLKAASAAEIGQVLVTSSYTAYGAWPDNPVPMAEDYPIRGVPDFPYARDKAESDRICQLWALEHPDAVMTIARPAIVFGPNVDNFIVKSWKLFPFIPLLDGADPPAQFIHEDDLVDGLVGLIREKKSGAYNFGADGTITWGECAEVIGVKTRKVNYRLTKRIMNGLWRLRLPFVLAQGGLMSFLRYPCVMSNEKLKADIGWKPKYTSRETFEITAQARGLAKGSPQGASSVGVPEGM